MIRSRPSSPAAEHEREPRIHPTLEDLVRLQFGPRHFSLLPKQPVTSLLSGRHASRLRGRGLTFEELRDYRPGDDIRLMDWKATARLRQPHVRVYSEERERPVLLVVDQRTPMFFGSARTTKATAAAETAALAAWRTLSAGDRVGALVVSDDDVVEIRPQRSKRNVLRICQALVEANGKLAATKPRHAAETLNDALWRAEHVARHDHLILVITDFADADETTRRHTANLASHNDVMALLVYDPLGANLPVGRPGLATDGGQTVAIPDGKSFQARFEAAFVARCDELRSILQALRIPILPICTHETVRAQLAAALGHRP
ncbi:MAG: DUF58 domain-containing protein [Planctomycetota bacterium]